MTDERYVDDPSNVRQIGERGGDPVESVDSPSMFDPPSFPPAHWDDTPHAVNGIPPNARPSQPTRLSSSPGSSRRQQIIDEAADLANQALEVWRQAVDVMGIVDAGAGEKYSQLTKGIASTVEDWEKKL